MILDDFKPSDGHNLSDTTVGSGDFWLTLPPVAWSVVTLPLTDPSVLVPTELDPATLALHRRINSRKPGEFARR